MNETVTQPSPTDAENVISETPNVEAGEAPAGQPGLNLVDIKNTIAVIDHACEQGAFKTWEVINQVWGVRFKLAAFVEAVEPPSEETETPETPETPETANDSSEGTNTATFEAAVSE